MTTLHTRALTSSPKKFDYDYSAYLDLLPTTSAYSIVTPDGANIESAGLYACVIDTEVAPPTANYSVSADVKVRTIVSGNSAGIILRGSGTEKKAYYLQLYADGTLKLQRDGPWNGNLATASVPLSAGTTYRVEGVIDGNQIWGYVDGVLKIGPITDVAITDAGYPGYVTWADSAGVSDSTGMAVSNLSLDTLGGASPTLVTVANSRQANTASAVSVSQSSTTFITVANSQQANTASTVAIVTTASGTITLPPFYDWNTGVVIPGETGVTVWVSDDTTGELAAKITGISFSTNTDCPISHASIVAGTDYYVRAKRSNGAEAGWTFTAS